MYGANYPYAEYGPFGGQSGASAFVGVRPGYDVRSLLAAAQVLASRGQQQACEALLTETRGMYQEYLIDMRNAHIAKADVPAWREHLIAQATPVSADTSSIKFDGLIGIDVVNAQNVGLGSIDDLLRCSCRRIAQRVRVLRGRDARLDGADRWRRLVPAHGWGQPPHGQDIL